MSDDEQQTAGPPPAAKKEAAPAKKKAATKAKKGKKAKKAEAPVRMIKYRRTMPCHCGSRKPYKNCHMRTDETNLHPAPMPTTRYTTPSDGPADRRRKPKPWAQQ